MMCNDCRAPFDPEDGHDGCPSCPGVEHLRQGLTELACVNCSCMAQLEGKINSQPPAAQRDSAMSHGSHKCTRTDLPG